MNKPFFLCLSLTLAMIGSCATPRFQNKAEAQPVHVGQQLFPPAPEAQRKTIEMGGQISGTFHDPGNHNRLTSLSLSFKDAGTGAAGIPYGIDKDAIYEIAVRFTSPTANISAVSVGHDGVTGEGLAVLLDTPTNIVTIYGTVPGSELDSLLLPWDVSLKPVPFDLPKGATKESKKEAYSFWGIKTGQFLDLNSGKSVLTTRDVNKDDDFGELAVDYQGDYVLQAKKPFKVFGFVTDKDDNLFKYSMLKDKVIVCMSEVPQSRVRLRGMIQGRKAVQAALGWAVY